jgi:hypothetical protein
MSSINDAIPAYQPGDQPPLPPAITPSMMESLKGTKPWVRFLSILGFIGTGFLVLIGLFSLLGAGFLGSLGNTPLGALPMVLIGSLYLILGFLYMIPTLYLFRYADGIQKALTRDVVGGLEYALKNQKSFWTFVGILAMIVLIIQVLALLVLIIVGVAGLAGLRGLR